LLLSSCETCGVGLRERVQEGVISAWRSAGSCCWKRASVNRRNEGGGAACVFCVVKSLRRFYRPLTLPLPLPVPLPPSSSVVELLQGLTVAFVYSMAEQLQKYPQPPGVTDPFW
jgi:hypothetical protein